MNANSNKILAVLTFLLHFLINLKIKYKCCQKSQARVIFSLYVKKHFLFISASEIYSPTPGLSDYADATKSSKYRERISRMSFVRWKVVTICQD